MRFERQYALEDDDGVARLRALTDYWKARHGIDSEWDGGDVRLRGRKMGVKYDAKVTIGVGRGRKTQDKRQSLKDKEAKQEMRDR